ncbi:MAG: NUDIX hydrolase [Hyphomicrobiaceae bacterium]|nr:NUDIX hydrolase [Hyphomicrobiaceae bacterium]
MTDNPAAAPPSSGEAKVPGARRLRPRDAATLVLVDRSGSEARVLMGRRRSTQVFLPNKFVFPGGRVDRADRSVMPADDLAPDDAELLLHDMKGAASATRARALALAAIRETFEETGLVIGKSAGAPAAGSIPAAWQPFLATGHAPSLAGLAYFARAITPPSRPRRYDTRFFLADARLVAAAGKPADDELGDLGWFTLSEMRGLDLPNITRAIVEDLATHLERPEHDRCVPYYCFRHGSFRRDLIVPPPA